MGDGVGVYTALGKKIASKCLAAAAVAALFMGVASPRVAAQSAESVTPTGDLTGRIGLGGQFEPAYPGARKLTLSPLPDIDLTYKKLFFLSSTDGFGIYAVNTETVDFGPAIFVQRGRSESDGPRLRGMGSIDWAPQARFNGEINVGPVSFSAFVGKDFGAQQGAIAGAEIAGAVPLITDALYALPSISANFGDGRYMQTWYGVSATQSLRTGYAPYRPGAGLESVGAELKLAYLMTKNWVVFTRFKFDYLAQAPAKSPIVQRRGQPTLGGGVSYRF
jgi:outer membrane protein